MKWSATVCGLVDITEVNCYDELRVEYSWNVVLTFVLNEISSNTGWFFLGIRRIFSIWMCQEMKRRDHEVISLLFGSWILCSKLSWKCAFGLLVVITGSCFYRRRIRASVFLVCWLNAVISMKAKLHVTLLWKEYVG